MITIELKMDKATARVLREAAEKWAEALTTARTRRVYRDFEQQIIRADCVRLQNIVEQLNSKIGETDANKGSSENAR